MYILFNFEKNDKSIDANYIMPIRNFILISLFFAFSSLTRMPKQQSLPYKNSESPKDSSIIKEQLWVDSVFNSLNENQRLGQLFMVAAFSNKSQKHKDEITQLIKEQAIGGLIFFQGGPVRQANLCNYYQGISRTPLLIAMDAEWGLGMRLDKDSSISYPKQMTLGAIQDNNQIYLMGKEIARQCRRLGVHVNFAPVVDVNNNPKNPVIGMRSFGEDKEQVAIKGIAYAKGMQDYKVMACAKHFPGHGDTDVDSHSALPIIKNTKEQITEIDLYPFRRLIADSIMSIMIAHLHMPAFDSRPNMATTLSKTIVTELLQKEMAFKGLIFTDALNMKGVSSFHKPGEVDVKALLAGNDVLLYSEDVATAIKKINNAIAENLIDVKEIDFRVKKILHAKYWAGLNKYKPIEITSLYQDLNNTRAKSVQLESYAKAITLIRNNSKIIPIKHLDTISIATLSIGLDKNNAFQNMVDQYAQATHFNTSKNPDNNLIDSILKVMRKYELVIVGLHGTNPFNSRDFGISENAKLLISKVRSQNLMILSAFSNPYSMKYFTNIPNLICAYEDNESTQKIVPQIIFGAREAQGKLPVTASIEYKLFNGINTEKNVWRNRYSFPETVQMDNNTLLKIDTLVTNEIEQGTMPGCQVLIAKDGQIVWNKNYGFLTYDKKTPVNANTIYDIASVTKVAGTLQALMFLEERGLVDVQKKISYYLPELKGTNKEDIIFQDVLIHQAGLTPFIAHWKKTLDSSGFKKEYYRIEKSDSFNLEVVPGLYALSSIEDSLWKWSIASDLQKIKHKKQKRYEYAYSDIGFYITKRIVETIINQPINEFLEQNFYQPLNLRSLCYKPLERFSNQNLAPTENDTVFRKAQLQGSVHDQGAALLGGVAGHAGIFSNASDLATLFQMNLNQGYYGGIRFYMPNTLEKFSKRQVSYNRRGLGWDKPEYNGGGPTSRYASSATFGHTGYTGTCVWIDPKYNLIYIFLSNRVYPFDSNKKLIKNSTRTKIQDIIYRSMINYFE